MRFLDGFVAALVLTGLALTAARLAPRTEIVADGDVRVVDGDTVVEGGRRLRLVGMDAPELGQLCRRLDGETYRCGDVARHALVQLLRAGRLECHVAGQDRYGRGLARCEAGGIDVGGELVRQGLAVSFGHYLAEERRAEAARIGLWSGTFERPSEWRRLHAMTAEDRDKAVCPGSPSRPLPCTTSADTLE